MTSFSWTCECTTTNVDIFPSASLSPAWQLTKWTGRTNGCCFLKIRVLHQRRGLQSAFSPAFLLSIWSSTACSPRPHSRSTPPGVTWCNTQSLLSVTGQEWRSSQSEEEEGNTVSFQLLFLPSRVTYACNLGCITLIISEKLPKHVTLSLSFVKWKGEWNEIIDTCPIRPTQLLSYIDFNKKEKTFLQVHFCLFNKILIKPDDPISSSEALGLSFVFSKQGLKRRHILTRFNCIS